MARPSAGMDFPQASMMFAPGMPPGMHGFMDPAMLGAGFGAVSRQLRCLTRVPGCSLLLQCVTLLLDGLTDQDRPIVPAASAAVRVRQPQQALCLQPAPPACEAFSRPVACILLSGPLCNMTCLLHADAAVAAKATSIPSTATAAAADLRGH